MKDENMQYQKVVETFYKIVLIKKVRLIQTISFTETEFFFF